MEMEWDATVLHTELERRFRVDHKRRERYSKEFRQQAVERMNACDNIARLSREIGVARHLLYHWRDRLEHANAPVGRSRELILARSGTHGAMSVRQMTSSAPRSHFTGSRRPSHRQCVIIGTIAGIRLIEPMSARPRHLVYSRTKPFPRGSHRGRSWSACITFGAGQFFHVAGISRR